ncbi:hypothetical protein B0H14DRAFT_2591454 [Mycena olivaceomarginata]|nr:hypothetical protein B0H14DRAFT_2591454 [Mycena olivaceomarginata]
MVRFTFLALSALCVMASAFPTDSNDYSDHSFVQYTRGKVLQTGRNEVRRERLCDLRPRLLRYPTLCKGDGVSGAWREGCLGDVGLANPSLQLESTGGRIDVWDCRVNSTARRNITGVLNSVLGVVNGTGEGSIIQPILTDADKRSPENVVEFEYLPNVLPH